MDKTIGGILMKTIAYLERDDLDEDIVVIKINRLYRRRDRLLLICL